jgi:hypothetical protein
MGGERGSREFLTVAGCGRSRRFRVHPPRRVCVGPHVDVAHRPVPGSCRGDRAGPRSSSRPYTRSGSHACAAWRATWAGRARTSRAGPAEHLGFG